MKKTITLKALPLKTTQITLIGDSPLIMNRWSEKAKESMLGKQMGQTVEKSFKDPALDYENAKYHLSGLPAFPAACFKLSAVRGAKIVGLVMTDARGAFFVRGTFSERDDRELVPIEGEFSMREDIVRLPGGVADIRYRASVKDWRATITITFNEEVLSLDHIVAMYQAAGFGCGIGDWRPEKNGDFGRYHVATAV